MHPNRRRKKRPNYGIRTVEVARGPNGFGFTISGQQPCILSCIVKDSPADQAGLRAGDFLISVNDVSVSKTTHDAVVNLIGSCVAPIKMTIAENYYSDSSDEDLDVSRIITCRKPKHKPKPTRTHRLINRKNHDGLFLLKNANHNCLLKYSNGNTEASVPTNLANNSGDQANSRDYKALVGYLGAMETQKQFSSDGHLKGLALEDQGGPIEYKTLVGYLGTIEMPEQLSPETRLQTVCNCIKKLRQEKRSPTAVLMTILPTCLTLKNSSNQILAIYPTNRVVYVGSARDKDSRYFGLVTSAISDTNSRQNVDDWHSNLNTKKSYSDIDISNSCHIFVTDPKLIDHNIHARKAEIFNIVCSVDPISGRCLEFPKDSLYIVSLIQSMYKLQCDVHSARLNIEERALPLLANSPQPSASSNSDSGIGFRDDFNSISDRIVLVEFPARHLESSRKYNNNFIVEENVDNRENIVRSSDYCLNPEEVKPNALLKMVLNNEKPLNNVQNIKTYEGVSIKNSFGDSKVENTKNSNKIEGQLNNFSHSEKLSFRPSFDKLTRNVSPSSFTSSDDNTKTNEACVRSVPNRYDQSIVNAGGFKECDIKSNFNEFEMTGNNFTFNQCNINSYQERPIDVPIEMELDRSNICVYSVPNKEETEFKRSADSLSMGSGRSLELGNSMSVFKTPSAVFFERKSKHTPKLASSCDDLNKCGNNKKKLTPKKCGTSKPNYSYEELNNMDFGQQLGYGSLNDLFFSNWGSNRERRQIARSEPDVRMQEGTGMSCFMNETDCQASKDAQESSVQVWTTSFEKLLEDTEGLKAFTEFLKKEFSSENIDFWIAVERFRHLPSGQEKKAEARRIYQQHICVGAPEAVNVDSHGRQCVEQALHEATSNIFDQAQKQVLNLMKFDSYPRFLKSDVYKQCLVNSTKPNGATPIKLKKSLSNAEDRRRKSLLPWHRKSRSKSKDRFENGESLSIKGGDGSLKNEIHSSRSSLTSLDLAIANNMQNVKEDSESFPGNLLCRISFGNCSTTVVQIRPSESINDLVQRLLEKRGLNYSSFEVYTDRHTKPVDSNESSTTLAGCEVKIQQRVVFKLDLPNRKTVSVKSKATKMIIDVLKPILHKYDFTLDQVVVINAKDGGSLIDIRSPITNIDNLRLQVQLIEKNTGSIPEQRNDTSASKTNKLVEITNQVFEGILHEKSENTNSKPKSGSVKSEDLGSEHSSSYFGKFLRRDSSNQEWKKKSLIPRSKILGNAISKGAVTPDQNLLKNKPLIAKWKAGVNKLQVSPSSEKLVEGLTRAQKARLEDQRGTEINFELPDFLKDKEDDRLRKSPNHSTESNFAPDQTSNDASNPTLSPKTKGELDARVNYENQSIRPENRSKDDSPVNTPSKQMKLNNVRSFLPKFSTESNNFKSSQIGTQKTFESPLGKEFKMEPPPLPPKPKIVPLKPPNWGQSEFRRPKEISQNIKNKQALFLEHPSSSFV
ncbi:regulator of G-protein signaling loco isoform X2 [Coccinella septempunctata]|uniref:regulator of G-protein signaling loco isoform X2 n=1 Tax=Coccinella septempunctata TaxID=41139 RepID=UPI001D09497D|nr:regulator of G-protein signaling loco isoform X2 [Coccinella septempunctata]